ncbi:MAG: hypothetical protein AAF125_01725, partial [Chloroflexota bacterium]
EIRNRRRGIGDQAITIFRTVNSNVFDFSHIFFDGPWAMAIAEMLTNEAIKYAHVLMANSEKSPVTTAPKPLQLQRSGALEKVASRYRPSVNHICAEATHILEPITRTRKALKARTGLRLTVNDILVLYRTVFNDYYIPSDRLNEMLGALAQNSQGVVLSRNLQAMLKSRRSQNPSLLIPMDATQFDPKERLFPSTFRSPLPNFRNEHDGLFELRQAARKDKITINRTALNHFLERRTLYLGYLQAFGELMERYREIATRGESMGTAAIRLIAGLPKAMQQNVDEIPGQLTVVNEAIKGEEVFSNVGRVVAGSSITRFASAKDDNDKKILVWGIMTDDEDNLVITLRDFRPEVVDIYRKGHPDVAKAITQDYLDAYLNGLVRFVEEMEEIIATSVRRQ